jgi:predicted phosphohydrolase
MKFVCLSDTHKLHDHIQVPHGDVLIFAGDMCGRGGMKSVRRFRDWFIAQPHSHKIVVAGNHDWQFQTNKEEARQLFCSYPGVYYLEDNAIMINKFLIHGSPWQPEFCNWAFNLPRGELLARKWENISHEVDILITHSPPAGIMDENAYGQSCGCQDLKKRISHLKSLKLHVFGHIHEGYGRKTIDNITYVNASVCDELYNPRNPVQVVRIK